MIDRALASSSTDPYLNLALEESLLERGFGGGSALFLYANSPCVVIGRNQNPWAEASAPPGPGPAIPLLRRVSGGGTVYQDLGNLNWSLILPRSRHDREAELALVAGALRELGILLEPGPRGGLFVANEGPFKGSKVSGTARRLASERVLHHGTLLVDSDLPRLAASLGGMKVESSKALASVPSPCANLSDLLPGLGIEEVAALLARALVGKESEEALSLADADYAEEAGRRLRSWEWTYGATPAFSLGVDWIGGQVCLEVRKGKVESVSGPGSERLGAFVGDIFHYGTAEECVKRMESTDI